MTTPVFLLAAGLGTRLRPLTTFCPKPLLPVGDRPALAHVLSRVRGLGGPVVVNAHHRAADLRAFLDVSAPDVLVSDEPRLLGTAGGLARAATLLGEGPVLVWNGDILVSLDAARVAAAHTGARDAEATLVVEPMRLGQGNVGVDLHGRVVRLRRETTRTGEVSGGAFLGVHVVGERIRARLPEEGCLVGDVYLPALREGWTLRVFAAADVPWHDIGTLRDYEAANFAWLAKSLTAKARDDFSFVGDDATVALGVILERSVVGRGARVAGRGVLEGCIVWPNTRVSAPLAGFVVTPFGSVSLRTSPE